MRHKIVTFLFTSILSGCLFAIPKNANSIKEKSEFAAPGMVAYAASYSSDPTNEPKYSTQNSKTFKYLNLGKTLDFYRGDSVKVGIIDSGINYDHEDFMVSGSTKVKGDSKYYSYTGSSWVYYGASSHGYSYIDDTLGHGTNVAATVAAAINGVGGLGLAPNVELYVYKVTNSNNGYEFGAIQNALLDAKTLDLDVINMSFQSYEHSVTYNGSTMAASSGCSTILSNYLNQAYNAGITLVGAAGNYNTDEPSYPGSNNHVINVGSLNQSGTDKAGFSNYGLTIDLVAPGYVYVADEADNTAYTNTQGTSFSAPLVTAAIALYIQQNPSATPAQIESALYASCDPIDDSESEYTNWAGNGALNVARFLGVEETDAPTSIVVNNPEIVNDELELEVGNTFDLDWTVNGVGTFDDSVTFSLYEDNGTLSINSNGRITALKEGTEIVTIESTVDSNVSADIYVTVSSSGGAPTVSSVTVSPSSLSLDLNGTKTGNLTATVNGDNNPSQAVTWSSSNTNVATVSSSGVVTAKAVGNATITATSELDNKKSGSCTVTVTDSSGATDTTQYTLITSTNDLEVGKSYLITNGTSGTVKTMSKSSNNNNRPCVDLTVSDSKLTRGSNALSVTLGGSTGAYTFKTENYGGTDGYLNATNTTGSNYLKVVQSLDNYAYFSISFSNDAAVITCTGKTTRNIVRYNSNNGSPIITCYSSGQSPVYLWKEVTTKTLSSISVSISPTKITYEAGDYFDPTGLVITRTYSDSTSDTYTYSGHTSEFTFSPSTSTALTTSNTSVTITYSGKSCNQAITVTAAKTLSSISISGYTTSFVEGDTFSYGGTVTATFSDSSSLNVTNESTFTGYNMTSVGNQTVTVSYTYKGVTKTQTYNINVAIGTLTSIAVSEMTLSFVKNSSFSFDGTCTATFANGYQKVVTPTSVSSPDMTSVGNKTITVSYTYNGKTETTEYIISVTSYREVIETTTTSIYCTYDFSKLSGTSEITSTSTIQNCYSNSGGITGASVISIAKTYAKDGYLRLATGSASGSVSFSFGSFNITDVTVVAHGWSDSEANCNMTITNGGTITTTSSSTNDTFNVHLTSATNSITINSSKNNRICIQSITFYVNTTTTEDIGHSEDCVGLESFIDNYMHMDYTDNLGYCSDSTHHYYATAKEAFNLLNDHQRKLFTTNSAYLMEWTRLSAWASKNGDTLNSSTLLAKGRLIIADIIDDNDSFIFVLISGLTVISFIGLIILKKRKKY